MNLFEHRSIAVYCRLFKYLKPYRKEFFYALLAMTVYGLTDGLVPLLIRSVLDDVFGKQDRTILFALPVIIVVFAILRGVFGFLQHYLAARVGLGIVKDIRNEIHRHLLCLSPSFFSAHSSGTLISRMTNDSLLMRTALADAASAILRDSIRIVALVVVAFYLDPFLAVIAIIGLPLCLLPMVRFGKHVRKLSRVGQEQLGGLTSTLGETIGGHQVIQAFTLEAEKQGRFEEENDRFTSYFRSAERYGALTAPTNELIASLAIAAVMLYGGLSVLSDSRTQGDFVAFLTAMFLLYEPVKKLSRVNNTVQTGVSAAERIFELIDAQPEVVEREGAFTLEPGPARVEYSNVSFCYNADDEGALTLEDVSFDVSPGESVALVGMSGGGKSTIVRLLPRFFDVRAGSIRINGHDIRDLTLSSLRRSVAIVQQNTFLFHDTVYQNIFFGRPEATREEVIEAAKAAHAHDFIMRLPKQYETPVGEQGLRLSGGERSRLAIARALLRDAPILILDEATAALDSESEQLVQQAIERLMVGRTVIVIAHRLATIQRADQILVVRDGRVVERGSHDDLLVKQGEYSKLYELQFQKKRSACG